MSRHDGDLAHLTLNTGHTRPSPRAEVGDGTIAMLRPLVDAGGGILPVPFAMYRLTVVVDDGEPDCAIFTVQRADNDLPLVTCFCHWGPGDGARFWAVVGTQLDTIRQGFPRGALPDRLPRRPRASPWLAVLVWPTALRDPEALGWLGDFERCVAWALIERGSGPRPDSTEKG